MAATIIACSSTPRLSLYVQAGGRVDSGHVILWPLASLGHLPVDVLLRRLDIARLTMDTAGNLVSSAPIFSASKEKEGEGLAAPSLTFER